MKPIAWYDPTNGVVSTDKDSPLFTPLGQVLPLYTQRTQIELTDDERQRIRTAVLKEKNLNGETHEIFTIQTAC